MGKTLKSVFIALALSIPMAGDAQNESEDFQLKRMGSHYGFTASLNGGGEATILLESGIHVMFIDSAFAFSNKDLLGLEMIPNCDKENMNLGGHTYNITHKAKGRIRIGRDLSYKGEIFILPGYADGYEVALPIQNLHWQTDRNSRIVELDFDRKILRMVNRKTVKRETEDFAKMKINTDTYLKMPAVRTTLSILEGGRTRTLDGNFVLDLGNAAFLFLLHQSKAVQDFRTANSDISFQQARNKKGDIVAEAVVADSCSLCGLEFGKSVVAITKALPRFTADGNIGLKFFDGSIVIFDFAKSLLYIKQKGTPQ